MHFNDIEFMPNGLDVTTANITGIGELSNKLECDFFATTTNEQRDVWLLYSFGLVNRTTNLIIFPFKHGFILCPHGKNDLDRFPQITQAFRCIWIRIPIGKILVLIPTRSDAEVEAAMAHNINCTRHFSEKSRVTITITSDHLSDTNTFGIAS